MHRDANAFRERFQRWKAGEQVYDRGRIIHAAFGLDDEEPTDALAVRNRQIPLEIQEQQSPVFAQKRQQALEEANARNLAQVLAANYAEVGPAQHVPQQLQEYYANKEDTRRFMERKQKGEELADKIFGTAFDVATLYAPVAKLAFGAAKQVGKGVIKAATNAVGRVGSAIGNNVGKVPKITAKNATRITPAQWTTAQDAAITRGDMAEAQRLRDLHFGINSPNNKAVDSNGIPLPSYHTVKDKYNPDFTIFNPEIEGTHSSIYTTDNPFMSGSYTTKITSEAERDNIIEVTRQRELNKASESLRNAQSRKATNAYEESQKEKDIEFAEKQIEIYSNPKKARKQILSDHPWVGGPIENKRLKRVYINLENPLILDNSGHGWNNIPLHQLPADVYDLIKPDIRGNLLNASYTTRSLEEAQKAVGRYDGSVIRDIVDYGGQKQYGYVEPGTDFQINNPSSIKLADAVTYDNNGIRIPLGERDNFGKNDIRYNVRNVSGQEINSAINRGFTERFAQQFHQFPQEVENILTNQIVPRRLRMLKRSQLTDGAQKIEDFVKHNGEVDFSTASGLKTAKEQGWTFEEVQDYMQYKDYQSTLNETLSNGYTQYP